MRETAGWCSRSPEQKACTKELQVESSSDKREHVTHAQADLIPGIQGWLNSNAQRPAGVRTSHAAQYWTEEGTSIPYFSPIGQHFHQGRRPPSADPLPLPQASLSFAVIHSIALAEILVPKFLSNGEGAPQKWRFLFHRIHVFISRSLWIAGTEKNTISVSCSLNSAC